MLRTVCTAALVTATALTLAPPPAAAFAASARTATDPAVPAPVPAPAPGALLTPAPAGAPGGPGTAAPYSGTGTAPTAGDAEDPTGTDDPGGGDVPAGAGGSRAVPEALNRLRALYLRAEEAGVAHGEAVRRLDAQRDRTGRLGRELARAREALAESRAAAGRLAREQYQGRSELSALLRVLLAHRPEKAFAEAHLMERAAAHRATTTARLERRAARAAALDRTARTALDRERDLAQRQRRAHDTAARRLREVEKVLASLSAAEIARLTSPGVRDRVMTPGSPAAAVSRPTAQGAKAVRYAVEQIGKPYVWGAEGPWSYDCSGLTSQAWAAAGRRIPRTSQEQWARLPRIPLSALRPGDLVVYFPGATHVAIYLGDGLVIQAPRPGATVKVSPLAANPLLGAVRPDPDGVVLPEGGYLPPALPEGAAAGDDTGYSDAGAPADAATSAR
ncbi:NlpC/P60 family protein [Streptomyces sp. NPDC014894]|uniref:C40 family peptidase n=1 Tax=Streptomyces sp. NPDC014894 TaxID=3364931 RepID=UPI0036FFE310